MHRLRHKPGPQNLNKDKQLHKNKQMEEVAAV